MLQLCRRGSTRINNPLGRHSNVAGLHGQSVLRLRDTSFTNVAHVGPPFADRLKALSASIPHHTVGVGHSASISSRSILQAPLGRHQFRRCRNTEPTIGTICRACFASSHAVASVTDISAAMANSPPSDVDPVAPWSREPSCHLFFESYLDKCGQTVSRNGPRWVQWPRHNGLIDRVMYTEYTKGISNFEANDCFKTQPCRTATAPLLLHYHHIIIIHLQACASMWRLDQKLR